MAVGANSVCATLCLGSLAGLLVWCLQRWTGTRPLCEPPLAPLGPWEALRMLTARDLPFRYAALQRQLGAAIYRLRLPFGRQLYVVADWRAAARILGDPANDKPGWFQSTKGFTGGSPSIFSRLTRDPDWQINRKAVAHAFAPSRLRPKAVLLERQLEPLYALLAEHARTDTPVPIADALLHLSLDFVALSAFDYDLGTLRGGPRSEGRRFLEELDIVLGEFALKRTLAPWRKYMWWDAEVRRAKEASLWLRELALRIMRQYRRTHSAEDIAASDDILAHILRNANYPDDSGRVGDVVVMLIGGHDTSSHTLAWALYDLARHPAALERLHAELDAAAAGGPAIPPAELQRLPWLTSCLRESMRLWPVAGAPTRELAAPLEHGGVTLPAKAAVKIAFLAISRGPDIPDADCYQPER
eukprot:EG_transcript_9233